MAGDYSRAKMRDYQRKRRGKDGPSPKTLAENASVLIAYAAGEITGGRACKMLGCDLPALREQVNAAVRSVTGGEWNSGLDLVAVEVMGMEGVA